MTPRDKLMHSNGTTAFETFAVILPSFFYTFLVCLISSSIVKTSNKIVSLRQLLLEFTLIVVPIILNITVLANYIYSILVSLYVVTVICLILRQLNLSTSSNDKKPSNMKIDFLTSSRATINLISVIGILAVDFLTFPRRFAKTLTYGYSLMDVGVGLYVFSNGIVAPEIRGHKNSFTKTVKSVIPLILLGIGRFFLTKQTDYNVPISEYGVHWNFFITLAVTKIGTSLILIFVSVRNAIFSGVSLLFAHETFLQLGLAKYVLGNVQRDTFFKANREGIVSSLGYIGLYYLSVAFGRFVYMENRRNSWRFFFKLCVISTFLLYATLILEKNFGVSRRLANSGYCVWIMFIGVAMTGLFCLGELILKSSVVKVPLIFEAINYNGLAFFLLANVLTGLINFTVDTLQINVSLSLSILVIYMLLNCCVVYFLFVKRIKLKL